MSRLLLAALLGLLVFFAFARGGGGRVDSWRFCRHVVEPPPPRGSHPRLDKRRVETELCFWHTTHEEVEFALMGGTP